MRKLHVQINKWIIALIVAVGLFVRAESVQAIGEILNDAEKGLICLGETAVSVLADIIVLQGCDKTQGKYRLNLEVSKSGEGRAKLDDLALHLIKKDSTTRGQEWVVNNMKGSSLDGVTVESLQGNCKNDRRGTISWGHGAVKLQGDLFGYGFIADLHRQPIADGHRKGDEITAVTSVQVVVKHELPKAKGWQTLEYLPPDGIEGKITGKITINKTLLVVLPDEYRGACKITVNAGVSAWDGLHVSGTVSVSRPQGSSRGY